MEHVFIPAPGIVIIELDETQDTPLSLSQSSNAKIKKGKVVAIGEAALTDFDAVIPNPARVGETWYFLNYNGDYDEADFQNKKLYMVKIQDLRAQLK